MKYPCNCLASQFLRADSTLKEVVIWLDGYCHNEFGKSSVITHVARDWGTMKDIYVDYFEKHGKYPFSAHLEYLTPEDEKRKVRKRKVTAIDERSRIFTDKEIEKMQEAVRKKFGDLASLQYHRKPVLHLHLEVNV